MSDTTEKPGATVRTLDATDPEALALLLPVMRAATVEDFPAHPEPGPGQLRAFVSPRGASRSELFATFDADGALAGFGTLGHSLVVNRTLAAGRLYTLPSRRGRGHGTALLARMLEWAAAEGCDRLVLDGPVSERGKAFAARNGGRVVSTDRRSALDLGRIDRGRFEEWARPSAKNADYRTVTWINHAPEELLPSYVVAQAAIDDAPHEGIELEARGTDVEPQRLRAAAWEAAGLRVHTLAAVTQQDEVAGYTQVFVYDDEAAMASIGDTAVVAAHRGHGLGLRMKAELTLRILELEPHVGQLSTFNDESNGPMLRVNTELGYEAADLWNQYLLEV